MRLALLPGLDGTGLLFDPLLAELPAQLDPLVVRYPEDPSASLSDLVDAAAKTLSDGGPWVLVAESFSGPIVGRLIVDRPDLQIAGVVFCASFLAPPRRWLLTLLRFAPLATVFGLPMPGWLLRLLCLGREASQDAVTLTRKALTRAGAEVLAARLRLLAGLPAFSHSIAVPCQYIRPTADRLVPVSSMRNLAGHCQRIETVHVRGGHFILQARPAPCARHIVDLMFAAECDRRDPDQD